MDATDRSHVPVRGQEVVTGIGNRVETFGKGYFPAEPAGLALAGKRQLATNPPVRQAVAPCRLKRVSGHRILEVAQAAQSGRELAGEGEPS